MIVKSALLVAAAIGALQLAGVTTAEAPSPVAEMTAPAELFKVDGGHSAVLFRILHLDAGPFWGRFNKISGEFQIDADDPAGSFVRVEIDAASVDSNSEGRDRHLKSPDFFNVKEFPTLTFASTSVEKGDGEGAVQVTGHLTMLGKKKEVTFTAHHVGTGTVSERFGLRSGFEAELTIKRSDFGMSYGLDQKVLGDEVRLIVALEGMK